MSRGSRAQHALWPALGALLLVLSACSNTPELSAEAQEAATEALESGAVQIGAVTLTGDSLENQPKDIQISLDPTTDPGIGRVAPTLTGTGFDGSTVEVGPGGEPTILLFVAHWCPHCQAEVPVVQKLVSDGSLPAGVRVVAVSTAVNESATNYPPSAWLEVEGWTSPTIMDDADSTAIKAFGGQAFPYAVFLTADNVVVARSAGEVSPTQIVQLAERLVG
ncbi:MAG: TlpA disulfide reductase family protein [Acidimicrobiales bacterium]